MLLNLILLITDDKELNTLNYENIKNQHISNSSSDGGGDIINRHIKNLSIIVKFTK